MRKLLFSFFVATVNCQSDYEWAQWGSWANECDEECGGRYDKRYRYRDCLSTSDGNDVTYDLCPGGNPSGVDREQCPNLAACPT